MTTFSLGINNCFAVKRWPRATDWAKVVRDDLGLELVQHSLDLVDLSLPESELLADADEIAETCRRHGVTVSSVFTGLAAYSTNLLLHPSAAHRERASEWYETLLRFSAALGASTAGGHLGSLSADDFRSAERTDLLWGELKNRLRHLSGIAHELGIDSLLFENMASDREPATRSQILDLLDPGDAAHTPVALCLDIGHQCVPGTSGDEADPYIWLEQLGGSAAIVHLQQSDAEGDHHWPFTESFNAAGRIDGARVLSALERSTATHVTLMLEVIPPFETADSVVVDELAQSVEYWKSAIAAHAAAHDNSPTA